MTNVLASLAIYFRLRIVLLHLLDLPRPCTDVLNEFDPVRDKLQDHEQRLPALLPNPAAFCIIIRVLIHSLLAHNRTRHPFRYQVSVDSSLAPSALLDVMSPTQCKACLIMVRSQVCSCLPAAAVSGTAHTSLSRSNVSVKFFVFPIFAPEAANLINSEVFWSCIAGSIEWCSVSCKMCKIA
jgi:hypothetical protein